MNILLLNGSPRKGGNTDIMAEAFMRGAIQNGNRLEPVRLYDLRILPCIDCGRCTESGGRCVLNDDMKTVYALLEQSDMLVIASPVYWWGVTAQVKLVIDRLHALDKTEMRVKHSALLMSAYDENPFDYAVGQYKLLCDFKKWRIKGMVTIGGLKNRGDVRNSDKLRDVYGLGKSVR